MNTLKPSTRQLIESFRYRRLAYLGREHIAVRRDVSFWHRFMRRDNNELTERTRQRNYRDYRLAQWTDKEASRTRAKDIKNSVAASYAKNPNQRF